MIGRQKEEKDSAVFENGQEGNEKSTTNSLNEEISNALEQLSKRYCCSSFASNFPIPVLKLDNFVFGIQSNSFGLCLETHACVHTCAKSLTSAQNYLSQHNYQTLLLQLQLRHLAYFSNKKLSMSDTQILDS